MTGLKVGLGFINLATQYADEGNIVAARRNLRSAQEAYEGFLKFLIKTTLTPAQRKQVERDLPRLKERLDAIEARLKVEHGQA